MREGIIFYGEELRAIRIALELRLEFWQRLETRERLTDDQIDEYNAVGSALERVKREIEKRGVPK